MNLMRSLNLFSSLDILTIRLEEKGILKKTETQNYASVIADKVEKFALLGPKSINNPIYWNITQGKKREETPDWRERLETHLSSLPSFNVKVHSLDNSSIVAEVSCEISLLVLNCKELTKELVGEIKCARVLTHFGYFELT